MNLFTNYFLHLWHHAASENNKFLKSLVESAISAKILDLGCSNGDIVLERISGKIKYPELYGTDIDKTSIQMARKKGIRVTSSNVEKGLPYRGNTFDVVSANQLIEHLTFTDQLLKEIFRVLKPGGYLLLSTENLASWHNIAALFLGWHPFSLHASDIRDVGNPFRLVKMTNLPLHTRHRKLFTLRSLLDVVRLHKFVIENWFGTGYYPLPPFLAEITSNIDPYHSAFIGLKARKPLKIKFIIQ